MTVPNLPNWTAVPVFGRYRDTLGNPIKGHICFTPNIRVKDLGDSTIRAVSTVRIDLDTSGYFSILLPATDDSSVIPSGWVYHVEENFSNGEGEEYDIEVSIATLPDGIDLVSQQPAVPVNPVATPVTIQQVQTLISQLTHSIPSGGTTGQILSKVDETDYNVQWVDAPSGGSGGGIGRVVSVISVNTTAGSAAGTDYVYFVSGSTTLTLPSAVGNRNRYSVINAGTGVVTVATTGSQTINGSATATLPITNMSLDFVSSGSNWNVE